MTAILKTLGAWPRTWLTKIHGGAYQSAGIPDIVGVMDGRFVALEVKVPGGHATPLQELVLARLKDAGALCGVVTSVEEAVRVVSRQS